jgi:positive regulator of sigma E activity
MDPHARWRGLRAVLAVIGMAIGGVLIAAGMALILGIVVMALWNWLMPDLFGLDRITFWQAWGLLLLSHILFKSFPHHKAHDHDDRWKKCFRDKFFSKEADPEKGDRNTASA